MKDRALILMGLIFLLMISPMTSFAAPIYYDLDFEDGTAGGGYRFGGSFGEAENIVSSNLDGRSLYFEIDDQMVWNRNDVDSTTHHVSFDFYAEEGANITQFLDIPRILRLDLSLEGRHHIDVYYDLSTEQAWAYLDGNLDQTLFTILAWPTDTPVSNTIRFANQSSGPAYSRGAFEIDNLFWEGNYADPGPTPDIPEPATMLLFGTGLLGLLGISRKKLNRK